MSSCFFLGHRETPDSIRPLLDEAIERHITEYGVTDFVVGHYGDFDNMAQAALAHAKERHPEIECRVLIPYHPAERPVEVPEGFAGTFYPPGMETAVKRYAITHANRYMIANSDYLIAYVRHSIRSSGTLLKYAMNQGIHIENLAGNYEP